MESFSEATTETVIPRSMVSVGERVKTEVIHIKNCQSGLGIKIAGGRSSLGTDFGVFVKKILSGGAADLDGRLREGDQLLEVNGYSLVGLSNEKAMTILRNSAQSNSAKLLINRDVQARAEFSKLITALNGGVSSFPSGATSVSCGSALMRSSPTTTPSPTLGKRCWVMNGGRMSPLMGGRHGSLMLSPSNSVDRPSASLQRMYSMDLPAVPVGPTVVQNTPGAFEPPSYNSTLQKLATPTSRTMYNPQLTGNSSERSTPSCTNQLTVEQQSVSSEVTNDSGLPTDRHSASSSPTFEHPTGEVQSIWITHSRGLGLCIAGGTNRIEGPHIYIDDIIEGGDAHKDSRLKNGDRLMYINGETLVGVTHEQAKSLLTRLKLRSQDVEITFIRGGLRPDIQVSNGLLNVAQSTPRETLQNGLHEVDSDELRLNLNGIENSNSSSPSRSYQESEADLSNTEIFMQELLAGPTGNSAAIMNCANYPSFGHYKRSPESQDSPPVISDTQPPGLQVAIQQEQGINPAGRPTYHLQQGIGLDQVPSTIPQRVYEGFQPTMSSTPAIANGGPNGFPVNPQDGALPSHIYSIGGLASQLHVNPLMPFGENDSGSIIQPHQSLSGSPHLSPLQTTCEYSSVPYHLQQDLVGLQRVSHQHSPLTLSQESLLTSPPVSVRKGGSNAHGNSRRLSLDPCTRLKVEKLEVALRYLGFKPTEEQQHELRQKLSPDSEGFVSYGDFVNSARQVLALELKDHSLTDAAVQFAVQDIHTSERESFVQMQQQSQQLASLEAIARQSAVDLERVRKERDEAFREVQHLKQLVKKKEETCLTAEEELVKARQQAQGHLEKSRLLEKRVHLASEAQKAAKDVEQDYAEVIRLLEKELDGHRSKETAPKPDVELQELQKRLVVLGCQLRKAEVSKRTYEVATEKLIHFAEMVHECLTQGGVERSLQQGKGQSVRRENGANPKPPTYLSRHAKYTPASLANEARETVKSVKTIIEEEPLPFGWEEAFTTDGVRYYINHVTQQTSWLHPVSQVQHLPPIAESEEKIRETST